MVIKKLLYRYPHIMTALVALGYIVVFVCVYWVWSMVNASIESESKSRAAQIKSLTTQVSRARKSIKIPKSEAFLQTDYATPASINNKMRQLLEGKNNLTLLNLKQGSPEQKSASQVFKQLLKPSGSKVSLYHFDLKMLTSYRAFLEFLLTLKEDRQIFWQSVNYNVSQYPDAVVDLKFYIVSKG